MHHRKSVVLQECSRGATEVLQDCYRCVVLCWCWHVLCDAVLMLNDCVGPAVHALCLNIHVALYLLAVLAHLTRVLQDCYKIVTRVLPVCCVCP
jgi:hypothetical protein